MVSNDSLAAAPAVPVPQGHYVPAARVGSTIRTAGMTPRRDGRLLITGRVGIDVDVRQAREAAAVAVRNALVAAGSMIEAGEHMRCAEMTVYIACDSEFTALSSIADGASEVLAAEFGPDGLPARSAVGVYALPGGSPVEVALVAEVSSSGEERRAGAASRTANP
ncbi:RidA family protein [Streptomyces sp. SID6673]|nr:RidA family protein [Streptomyces sp. SID11726]NEB26539.1 RidA family protein [Streptomyces sp. SID6673]